MRAGGKTSGLGSHAIRLVFGPAERPRICLLWKTGMAVHAPKGTMQTVEATCPHCHKSAHYGAELIGRYTLCQHCHCRFYVVVPKLAEMRGGSAIRAPKADVETAKPTTIDDLLLDTQEGSRIVMRWLRQQDARMKRLGVAVTVLLLLGLLNLAVGVVLVLKIM